ncbi:MAG: Rv1355c family protein [Bacteroidia bacterium]|nr:Rv1355c family protein [Bacteroidia bacterium]
MQEQTTAKINHLEKHKTRPDFFDKSKPGQAEALEKLLTENPHIQICDEIIGQLAELIKCRNAQITYTSQSLNDAVIKYISGGDTSHIGTWVYYPWSFRLVHILHKEDFIELRTSRNNYKITLAERNTLSTKKIGVIGLSVGQSVSVTLAMERGFGQLRIADYDILELSNYNRIRTPLHNLGLLKTVSVAREIAEIDPYLDVVCFHDGITEENMDSFFTGDGKLDLLIDESDGLDIKILARLKARSLGIPVVQEASDRGMVDIERFDLEPDRPLLHGLVGDINIDILKSLKTNEDKIPYMLQIVGLHTVSERTKASMLEIGETITTWPQLASAVTLGGGITADVSRKILLDEFHKSGRFHVDMDEIFCDPVSSEKTVLKQNTLTPLTKEWIHNFLKTNFKKDTAEMTASESEIETLINAVLLAPSAGNTQPWKWALYNGIFYLFHDRSSSVSFMDHNNFIAQIALGTAIETFSLESKRMGFQPNIDLFPAGESENLVATISIKRSGVEMDECDINLANEIGARYTNRNKGNKKPLPSDVENDLKNCIGHSDDLSITLVDNQEDMMFIANTIALADRIRLMHKEGHPDFFVKEMRWTKEQAEKERDGLDIRTAGFGPLDVAGLHMASYPAVISLLRSWNKGAGLGKLSKKLIASSTALGILSFTGQDTVVKYINSGRAIQRLWLLLNHKNWGMQPMLSPIAIWHRVNYGKGEGLSQEDIEEMKDQQAEFNRKFLDENREPVFIFRIFEAEKHEVRSLRKPLTELFFRL